MQNTIKLLRLRRVGVRLLCLIAAVLALSQTAGAYDTAYIEGDFANLGLSDTFGNWKKVTMNKVNGSSNYYAIDLTPTQAGTAYMYFHLNSDKFCTSSGSNTELPTTETKNNAKKGDNGQFELKVSQDKVNVKHTLHVYTNHNSEFGIWVTTGGTVSSTSPGIEGEWPTASGNHNNWGKTPLSDFTEDSDGWWYKTVTMPANPSNRICFRIVYDGKHLQPNQDSDLDVENGSEYPTKEDTNAGFRISTPTANKAYTIWFNTSSKKVKVTWSDGGDTPTVDTNVFFHYTITGDGLNVGMTDDSGAKDKTYFTCIFAPTENADYWIAVKNGNLSDNQWVAAPNDTEQISFNNKSAMYDNCTVYSTDTKRIKISLNKGKRYKAEYWPNYNSKHRIQITELEEVEVYDPSTLPVYPIGVYDEEGLSAYTEPLYYLLGEGLNHERVTPEYQFTKITASDVERLKGLTTNATANASVNESDNSVITEGKYFLELTMRNTKLRWTKGDNNWGDHPLSVIEYSQPTATATYPVKDFTWNNLRYHNDTNTVDDFLKGYACVAVYDPTTETLSIVKKNNGLLPFISLVGANWRQNTKANGGNPFTLPSRDDGKIHDTDDGWQDAWIQYDATGQVAKSRSLDGKPGHVMFNTMWPPRNQIKFATDFKVGSKEYNFTLGSDDLVLTPTEYTYKGSQWKGDNMPEDIKTNGMTGAALFKNDGNLNLGDTDLQFVGKLALDDDTSYRLYKVEDVWVNGKFKFWTGWTGGANNSNPAGANWANHSNWGHFKKQENDKKQTVAEGTSAQQIGLGSTVPLGDTNGDMIFKQPTFFKTLYFFYDTENGIRDNQSVFVALPARGGADVAALSRAEYTRGMYRPRLSDVEAIKDLKIKNVIIKAYNADTKEFVTDVKLPEVSALDKTVAQFQEIFKDMPGESGNTDQDGHTPYWVYDPYQYPNGTYYYTMKIVLNNPSATGGEETIEVKSNPFRIFSADVTTELVGYQLVKRIDPTNDGLGDKEYQYVSYRYTTGDQGYINDPTADESGKLKYYLLKLNITNYNTDYKNKENKDASTFDEIVDAGDVKTKLIERTEKIDLGDATKYRFSAKIVLIGDISSNEPGVSKLTITGNTINPLNVEMKQSQMDSGDKRYFCIVEPKIDNNDGFSYTYTWKTNYTYSFADGETTAEKSGEASVTFSGVLALPEPKLIAGESYLEMFYGLSENNADDNTPTGTFSYGEGDDKVTLTEARYQQFRKRIVIERPNVTLRYRAKAIDYIKGIAAQQGLNVDDKAGAAPLVDALFELKVAEEEEANDVTMKFRNDKILQEHPRQYVFLGDTKNPAHFYFKQPDGPFFPGEDKPFQGRTIKATLYPDYELYGKLPLYKRWNEANMTGVRMTGDAPVNEFISVGEAGGSTEEVTKKTNDNQPIQIIPTIAFDPASEDHLIEKFQYRIYLSSTTRNTAYLVDDEGNKLSAAESGKPENVIEKPLQFDADGVLEDGKTKVNDYFYVKASWLDGKDKDKTLFVAAVKASDLYKGWTSPEIRHDWGHWWDGLVDHVMKPENRLYKKVKLEISHIYPFNYGKPSPTEPDPLKTDPAGLRRKAGDASTETTEGWKAKPFTFDPTLPENNYVDDIVTSVDTVDADVISYVNAGVGFIEAYGETVEIYGADGMKIATGAGRHEMPAGVYMVRLNNRVEKVIVR